MRVHTHARARTHILTDLALLNAQQGRQLGCDYEQGYGISAAFSRQVLVSPISSPVSTVGFSHTWSLANFTNWELKWLCNRRTAGVYVQGYAVSSTLPSPGKLWAFQYPFQQTLQTLFLHKAYYLPELVVRLQMCAVFTIPLFPVWHHAQWNLHSIILESVFLPAPPIHNKLTLLNFF